MHERSTPATCGLGAPAPALLAACRWRGGPNFASVQVERWWLRWRGGDDRLCCFFGVQAVFELLSSGLDYHTDRRLSGCLQRRHHISVLIVGVAAVIQKIYDDA